jgi:nitroreductase
MIPHLMFSTPDSVLHSLRWRYATKKFDATRQIPPSTWATLEHSLVLAPSSFGLQPWKFLVVENPALRSQLLADSWKQPQVVEASHFVVLAARTDLTTADIATWIARMAEIQGTAPETLTGLHGMIVGFANAKTAAERYDWNCRQVYLALGQLMTAAAMLEIDTCPMEGINAAAYDQTLGLAESGYTTVVACALGYRADSDKYASLPKARFEASQVIEHLR